MGTDDAAKSAPIAYKLSVLWTVVSDYNKRIDSMYRLGYLVDLDEFWCSPDLTNEQQAWTSHFAFFLLNY